MGVMFKPFPKIGRLSRDMIVTEKLDGTNAAIAISADGPAGITTWPVESNGRTLWMWAQSRSQVIGPAVLTGNKGSDNFGFAAWAYEHGRELAALGEGVHFGEWWGQGIQRGYGLSEKRWSLFNVNRWNKNTVPSCCDVVPVLHRGNFDTDAVQSVMRDLALRGSYAAPGFMKPEGVVIFHTQTGHLFKKTYEKDDAGKGREPNAEMPA